MATTDIFTALLPFITPHLKGCPDSIQRQAIRMVGREFCRDTHRWREQLATISTVADQADYTLTSTFSNVMISDIAEIEREGYPMDADDYTLSEDGATLTLDPAPTVDDHELDVIVVILPLLACSAYESTFINKYSEGLISGTLYKLFSQEDTAWYNPSRAKEELVVYEKTVNDARIENIRKRKGGDLMVQLQSWV